MNKPLLILVGMAAMGVSAARAQVELNDIVTLTINPSIAVCTEEGREGDDLKRECQMFAGRRQPVTIQLAPSGLSPDITEGEWKETFGNVPHSVNSVRVTHYLFGLGHSNYEVFATVSDSNGHESKTRFYIDDLETFRGVTLIGDKTRLGGQGNWTMEPSLYVGPYRPGPTPTPSASPSGAPAPWPTFTPVPNPSPSPTPR